MTNYITPDHGEGSLLTLPVADLRLGPGVNARRVGKHALHDLELRNIHGRVHVQEHRGIPQVFFDAEVEHDAVAAVQFHRVLSHLEHFLRGKQLDHVDELLGIRRALVDRARCFVEQRTHSADLGGHFREPDRDRLVLDQRASALHVVLHVLGGLFERGDRDA